MTTDLHELRIESDEGWAQCSADLLERGIRSAIAQRDRCLIALSGGSTPWPVLEDLASRDLPWRKLVVLQADERLVPADHPDRNLRHQQELLADLGVTWVPLPVDRLLGRLDGDGSGAESEPDADPLAGLDAETIDDILRDFTARVIELADDPPVIDIAQLGLGADGHTASLLPGDPAVDELRRPIALTGVHEGHRRLTLTRPIFDRARFVVWLITGREKSPALGRLLAGDLSMPAGLIRPRRSVVLADASAARQS